MQKSTRGDKRLLRAMAMGLLLVVGIGHAAEVGFCGELDRVSYLAGNPRTFGNGSIRVAAVDTDGEPVCCSNHLLVFIPEQGIGTQCFAISQRAATGQEGAARGFMSVDIAGIKGDYDANRGLLLKVPFRLYDEDGSGKGSPGMTAVRINLKGGGSVTVEE